MRPKFAAVAGACLLASLVPALALAKRPTPSKAAPSYYVALGDSLARGAQPNSAGVTVPTNSGYANFLYATEKRKLKGLQLEELGCLGESTTTMRHGGICHYYAGGSQLAAAVRFIKQHRIALITLDIGANDVDGCGAFIGTKLFTCVASGLSTIKANLPTIVKALRTAAGPKVKIVGMTYAPFTTTTTLPPHGTVPLAVAQICRLTWMCAAAPTGPNIHANTAGYQTIAGVFAAQL